MNTMMFKRMCEKYPHLAPVLVNTVYKLEERSWDKDKPSLFDIIKKDNYIKTNGKKCYVETFIKTIEVDRKYLTKPNQYSYYWIVRGKYKEEILNKHLNNAT